MKAPRDANESLAGALGVSKDMARRVRSRLPDAASYDLTDAKLRADAALADLDAARSIDADDIEAVVSGGDDLDELLATRSERSLRAKIAAHSSWANTDDRAERTRKGREAMDAKFEREVDPEGKLDPVERARRAEHARKAYYYRLALKSAQARRAKK